MRVLLARYSYRTAAIILSLVNLLGGLGAVFFMRDRTPRPIAGSRPLRAAIPLDFLRRSPFWAFLATVGVTGLGVFLPALWLPTYGQDIGLSQSTSTVLLVVMNSKGFPPNDVAFSMPNYALQSLQLQASCC